MSAAPESPGTAEAAYVRGAEAKGDHIMNKI